MSFFYLYTQKNERLFKFGEKCVPYSAHEVIQIFYIVRPRREYLHRKNDYTCSAHASVAVPKRKNTKCIIHVDLLFISIYFT